jgi:excisionase family DNA binding protein
MTAAERLEQPDAVSAIAGARELVEAVKAIAVARIAYTPEEAAASLGVSRDFFDEHIKRELAIIRRGRLVLIPVRELEQWAAENAARASRNGAASGSARST